MSADNLAFPWAAKLDADQLAAFIEDLWGAASGDNDLATLDAIEKVIAAHGPEPIVPRPCPLTEREVETLTQIANGASYTSAARDQGVSLNTLKRRIEQIYIDLGVHNASHACAVAAHLRWLPDLHIPEPPAPVQRRSSAAWQALYRERSAEMREQPGQPVEIGPYGTCQGARNATWRINKGLLDAFQPAGAFKARPFRAEGGHWFVTGRYVGLSNSAERPAS